MCQSDGACTGSHDGTDVVAVHVFPQRADLAVIDFYHPRINVVVRRAALEAADAAGVRPATARVRLFRARRKLRDELEAADGPTQRKEERR